MSTAPPHNRLGIDYRSIPPRVETGRIVDIHTHVGDVPFAAAFFEAAAAYGVTTVVSMSALERVPELQSAYGDRIAFIAVPAWRKMGMTDEFRSQWIADLAAFRRAGARLCKFWMAPPMRERHQLTLPHPWMRPVIDAALDLGYEFMLHIGDPSVWFAPGAKYENAAIFGTKHDQYPQLEWFCDLVAPRRVISAHMGGTIEEPEYLAGLLARHSNLYIDTSATKWIVREVACRPDAVRTFVLGHADRILFGSDLVVDKDYPFDHHASRYWAQRMMWESNYRGESPIEDPDAPAGTPQLAGLALPGPVLRRIYEDNAAAFGY